MKRTMIIVFGILTLSARAMERLVEDARIQDIEKLIVTRIAMDKTHGINRTLKAIPEESGKRNYIGTYPFARKRGLVKIDLANELSGALMEESDITVMITRQHINHLIILAFLTALGSDGEPCAQVGEVWVPWRDDCIVDAHGRRSGTTVHLRGGNRLTLTLNKLGNYHITVPHDADVETNLEGNACYYSQEPTYLSTEINGSRYGGEPGMLINNYSSTKNIFAPKTSIKIRKGCLAIPEEVWRD